MEMQAATATEPMPTPTALMLEPIGTVRSALRSKAEAARQPRAAEGIAGRIELFPGRHLEHALEDLAGWEYLWVIFWFHLNEGWRPKVLPPRSRSGRKGVFATRSPHRPNPLGLSVVRLERIEGLTLHLCNLDMLEGTPVLDIKPYVAYTDAIPQARAGWLEGAGDPLPAWMVAFSTLAAEQSAWITTRTGLELRQRITATLALGPEPHPYRRIRRTHEGLQLAVKEWRVRCAVHGSEIHVLDIASGYRATQLAAGGHDAEPFTAHREFLATFAASS